ncbi:endonuclease/exonuclease/phosphatase family protein [Zunongwangia sp. F363]|uniref:Endonuclease/exonuclease/phosphatase family protein n=1 Tax=Autumnicola tepida TaxID=3075595 RepID=A0ABU3C9R3_9FLAO|nr:endonuclease/exonuclease/phosphatase family protein [Zunongwangia sp. F363]MDT0643073.1 endonuclease/exonuclease/phosphatase family protein [Zunongwangia sp. F363]
MKLLWKILYYFIIFCCTLLILCTLLSLIYDIPRWYLKVLDFPRTQYLICAVIFLILFILINRKWKTASILLTAGLVASIGIQLDFILPYFIAEKSVPNANMKIVKPENTVSILLGNVLITNHHAEEFLNIIRNNDPDMVLAMEVNDWWVEHLKSLKKDYPYQMSLPLDNAYGMVLYSKMPLKNSEIKFFNHSRVPSFHAEVELPSGKSFRFHGMHPVAPFPSDKYPENIGDGRQDEQEEIAMQKLGSMVARDSLPSIVAGDFNDVSWSHTSRLLEKDDILNNVRIGRGLYNTFDAKSLIMRWPLDHFFVSKEFSVVEIQRLPKFNSDHFPILAELAIESNASE